jgi:ketosteroid isomerase-like protein
VADAVAIVQRVVESWNAHDLDAVYSLLHEGYREYVNGVEVPGKRGPRATRVADQPMYDAVPDYRREVDELFGDGSRAAMRWRFLGTGPNGEFEIPIATTYTLRDGKILEAWLYGDPLAVARALGGA